MIKDIFKDILRHTPRLGSIEMVKISGDELPLLRPWMQIKLLFYKVSYIIL